MGTSLQHIMREGYSRLERARPLPSHVRRCAQSILACRTAELGGHMQVCPEGHFQRAWYNSCKHRVCPQCAFVQVERWLSQQKERLLACEHYHVIFTLPSEFHPLWLAAPRVMTNLLFQAAQATLFELLGDPKYLGARPGVICALHTWGQTLVLHPHLHCLVTGGGRDEQGRWRKVTNGILLPARVVMALFRGKFLALVRQSLLQQRLAYPQEVRAQQMLNLLNQLGRRKWNVRICKRYAHGVGVATYLSRYLRGGPIANSRLVRLHEGKVSFRYKQNRARDEHGRAKRDIMTLSAEDFLQRYFLHVPSPHTQVVRSSGLYANSKKEELEQCRAVLGQAPVASAAACRWQECCAERGDQHPEQCPTCGVRLVMGPRLAKVARKLAKGPPEALAA